MAQKPDAIVAALPFAELEQRLGLPSIASLEAERDDLVKKVAPLRARHGSFGTYNDLRKIELATISAKIRAMALEKGTVKVTEAFLDEAAHSSDEYIKFVTDATLEKAEWSLIENAIQGVEDTIRRSNGILHYLAAEAKL